LRSEGSPPINVQDRMNLELLTLPRLDIRRTALGLPVFHKIWLASVAVVIITAGLAVVAVASAGLPTAIGTASAAVVAAAGALLLQGMLVRLALRPIDLLAEAAERVTRGDESARVPITALADPQIRRVIEVFNEALEQVAGERERLRALAARAREIHEAERLRTAQQLHESVAQSLGSMLLRLQIVRRASTAEARDEAIHSIREDVASAAEAVQRIAFSLRPPAIADLGACAAIQAFAREMTRPGVEVECELPSMKDELSSAAETTLYRIVEEAVENAVRHSSAQFILIRGRLRREWVEVEVVDDGKGFSVPSVVAGARCLGVFEMEQRAERLGGSVEVESEPGHGTTVRIQLPRCAVHPVTSPPATAHLDKASAKRVASSARRRARAKE
jgi:two-component system, NarL family, sensor histidine kinase UhpB